MTPPLSTTTTPWLVDIPPVADALRAAHARHKDAAVDEARCAVEYQRVVRSSILAVAQALRSGHELPGNVTFAGDLRMPGAGCAITIDGRFYGWPDHVAARALDGAVVDAMAEVGVHPPHQRLVPLRESDVDRL